MEAIRPKLPARYDAHVTAQRRGAPFFAACSHGRGRVLVDGVSAGNVGALQTGLKGLGTRETVSAGRIVWGQLPILAIRALAKLQTLRLFGSRHR